MLHQGVERKRVRGEMVMGRLAVDLMVRRLL